MARKAMALSKRKGAINLPLPADAAATRIERWFTFRSKPFRHSRDPRVPVGQQPEYPKSSARRQAHGLATRLHVARARRTSPAAAGWLSDASPALRLREQTGEGSSYRLHRGVVIPSRPCAIEHGADRRIAGLRGAKNRKFTSFHPYAPTPASRILLMVLSSIDVHKPSRPARHIGGLHPCPEDVLLSGAHRNSGLLPFHPVGFEPLVHLHAHTAPSGMRAFRDPREAAMSIGEGGRPSVRPGMCRTQIRHSLSARAREGSYPHVRPTGCQSIRCTSVCPMVLQLVNRIGRRPEGSPPAAADSSRAEAVEQEFLARSKVLRSESPAHSRPPSQLDPRLSPLGYRQLGWLRAKVARVFHVNLNAAPPVAAPRAIKTFRPRRSSHSTLKRPTSA